MTLKPVNSSGAGVSFQGWRTRKQNVARQQSLEVRWRPDLVKRHYDPELNLIYWGTGQADPDFVGDIRPGDNLYSECVVALDPETGKLKWYFQFTPHDVHDWDAVEIPVLVDAEFRCGSIEISPSALALTVVALWHMR